LAKTIQFVINYEKKHLKNKYFFFKKKHIEKRKKENQELNFLFFLDFIYKFYKKINLIYNLEIKRKKEVESLE
jgi:hypothetical protein